MNLDELQRRLDLEFFRLSTWVRSQRIPMGDLVMDEIKFQTIKRRKLRSGSAPTEQCDGLYKGLASYIDGQIRAALQKMKVCLAKELERVLAEVGGDLQLRSDVF
jgi:hypothetical protein